jgi:serine beta-lactamase-like protein LACTB
MASISKALTSSLVGKLIEEGKLEWDTPIYEYLPRSVFPIKKWQGKEVNITLKQVMSHTAGLRTTVVPTDFVKVHYERKNVTEVVMELKDEPLRFEPGTDFAYSNYGFQVVGAIIESLMNETYETAITKFFKQIGLKNTFPERIGAIYSKRARYYEKNGNQLIGKEIWDDLWSFNMWWPSGGLMSTAGDLLKYGNAMIDSSKGRANSILKASTVKQLWTPNSKSMNNSTFGKKL